MYCGYDTSRGAIGKTKALYFFPLFLGSGELFAELQQFLGERTGELGELTLGRVDEVGVFLRTEGRLEEELEDFFAISGRLWRVFII